MKAEVKKAIEDAAENIFGISRDAADGIEGDGAQEVRARVNLVRQGLDALREDAEALGECFDGGDLPFFCRLVERTGKVKYVNRLKNHEDKLARARAELAGLESAGK